MNEPVVARALGSFALDIDFQVNSIFWSPVHRAV